MIRAMPRASAATAALLLPCLMLGLSLPAQARDNGLGRVPPLGWNTWCTWSSCHQDAKMWPNLTHAFHDVCTEDMVKDVAQSMLDQGMHAAGYTRSDLCRLWSVGSGQAVHPPHCLNMSRARA